MIAPMLASLTEAPLDDPQLVYEPKYDGIRAIVEVGKVGVRIWSRLGNEKTHQFPEIVAALKKWAGSLDSAVTLDGEIVALDGRGAPVGFQQLQGRIHLADASGPSGASVAFIAFDLLKEGRVDWRDRPLVERRAALERVFGQTGSPILRLSPQVRGDGRALYEDALAGGWEGLIAKHAASLYKSGKRTPDWRKVKIVHEQEFVIGGWTEPRQTRSYFGALLIGVYAGKKDALRLVYAGHIGTGFNEKELARVMALLRPLATDACPFEERPKTNERAHWVRPELVAQIKFTEWTADGKLRHPVYLGLRDDKKATDVKREQKSHVRRSAFEARRSGEAAKAPPKKAATGTSRSRRITNAEGRTSNAEHRTSKDVIEQLHTLEDARKDGVLKLPDGDELNVTNLHKVFWPQQ